MSSVERKRMYKAKKMWVVAGAVGLAFGGVMLSDYAGVTVDQAGVHVVHQTADAAVVQGANFYGCRHNVECYRLYSS